MKRTIAAIIAKIAQKVADKSYGQASIWLTYQPKEPQRPIK